MKKILILVALIAASTFASQDLKICEESRLSEVTSVFTCTNGLSYEATFALNVMNTRDKTAPVKIKLLSASSQLKN